MITTTDFSKFGYIEREEAENLLKASREQGFPDDFIDDETTIMFNQNSGYVFFTNADYQVAMLNGDKLESFYTCSYCGEEGFRDDLKEYHTDKDLHKDCKEFNTCNGIEEG